MFTVITALIVCAALVYIFRRAESYVSRLLSVMEQKQANSGSQAPKKVDPIPQYLWLEAMNESEQWAREDALKRFHQLYEEHGADWDKVARVVIPNSVEVER